MSGLNLDVMFVYWLLQIDLTTAADDVNSPSYGPVLIAAAVVVVILILMCVCSCIHACRMKKKALNRRSRRPLYETMQLSTQEASNPRQAGDCVTSTIIVHAPVCVPTDDLTDELLEESRRMEERAAEMIRHAAEMRDYAARCRGEANRPPNATVGLSNRDLPPSYESVVNDT